MGGKTSPGLPGGIPQDEPYHGHSGLLNKKEIPQLAHFFSGVQKHRSALGGSEHPVFEYLSHIPTITVIENTVESMSSLNWGW